MMARQIAPLLIVCAALCASRSAMAATSVHVLAIGYNGTPATEGRDTEVALRYADDDAVAFYQFTRDFSRDARLLTLMDPDTQRRFPTEAAHARVPTLAQLRAEVGDLRKRLDEDRDRGDESVVLFYYSGHGARPSAAPAGLTLLDGFLTQETLYEEVLGALPARYIHVFIDACYAEAIVRPRDADAAAVDVSDADLRRYASRNTLARFPNVGAIVASSTSTQTHEWDNYRHGVFTHELLSGLRGGADVNVDGKIEYSELYAFLAAANRAVSDARAKLSVVVRPPTVNARAPIVDASDMKTAAHIAGIPSSAGQVYVEDQFGNRLADVRVESGATLDLWVPADRRVFLRCQAGEAEVKLQADQTLPFERLAMAAPTSRVRGVMDQAMRRGLFATGFGPNYYRGFIDQTSGLVSVPLPEADAPPPSVERPDAPASLSSGPDVALLAAGGVTEGIGRGLGPMAAARIGLRPAGSSGLTVSVVGAYAHSAFTEGRALASVGYRVGLRRSRLDIFAGGETGGGVAFQKVSSGHDAAWTGALLVTPVVGFSYRLVPSVTLGSEGVLEVLGYRRDDRIVVSPLLAAYFGMTLSL